jgi:hypothetical protein
MFPFAIVLGLILSGLFVYGLVLSLKAKKTFIPVLIFATIFIYYLAQFKFSAIIYFKHMSAVMPLIFIFPALALVDVSNKNKKVYFLLLWTIIILSVLTLLFYYNTITTFTEWISIIGH